MNSLIKWLGPGAVVGGMGAAMLCGAGLAGADTGADAGPGTRGPQASASASGVAKTGADQAARKTRSGPSGVASARLAAASVKVRTNDYTPSATPAPAPAAAVVSAAPAAAVPAARPAVAAAVPAGTPAPAAAASAAAVVPSSVPVDPAKYAGTYYEHGSVKQFFSIGLVNTKAVYTAKTDGTLGVKNSGNYFFNCGPKSTITGSAVPVNATNTALNVGFGGAPSANPPGNYLILDRAPDYSWAIVSDPSGRSGYILTRSAPDDPGRRPGGLG
jgi:lipocalin